MQPGVVNAYVELLRLYRPHLLDSYSLESPFRNI